MRATERQEYILKKLQSSSAPISASSLAKELQVSRQVIVGDVALLRAKDHDIIATHRGYILSNHIVETPPQYRAKIVCKHSVHEVQRELEIVVENGGKLLDVQVEHPIYGTLSAPLNISTFEDILYFMEKLSHYQESLLSSLTDGIHIHTISCDSRASFEQIKQRLAEESLLFTEN